MVSGDLQPESDHLRIAADFPDTSLETLYEMFADSNKITQWWPALATLDVRPGGAYVLSWPDQGWHLRGEFTQVEPKAKLAYTWKWDHELDLPSRLVDLQFRAGSNGAELIITQGPYSEAIEDQKDREGHVSGWQYFLGRLQVKLEEGGL